MSSFESSPGERRHVCSQCGSPLFSRTEAVLQLLSVRCGTLEGDPGVRPSAHIHVASRSPWYEICDDLVQRPEGLVPDRDP